MVIRGQKLSLWSCKIGELGIDCAYDELTLQPCAFECHVSIFLQLCKRNEGEIRVKFTFKKNSLISSKFSFFLGRNKVNSFKLHSGYLTNLYTMVAKLKVFSFPY